MLYHDYFLIFILIDIVLIDFILIFLINDLVLCVEGLIKEIF